MRARSKSSRLTWGQIVIIVLIVLLAIAFAVSRSLPRPSRTTPRTPTPTPQSSSSNFALPDIPGMVSTKVAVLNYIPPAIPTPWPTPVQDLAMLTQQADVIAQATIRGTNGAMHSEMYYLTVEKWLKRPSDIMTDTGILWIADPWEYIPSYGFRNFKDIQADRGDRLVLFMIANGTNTFNGSPDYRLVGSATGYFGSGFFRVANGKIGWGGIRAYDQWPVAKFEDEIFNLQVSPPSP